MFVVELVDIEMPDHGQSAGRTHGSGARVPAP
jgi:hypothetical protein